MRLIAHYASSSSLDKFRLVEFIAVARALDVDVTILDNIDWLQGEDSNVFSVFETKENDFNKIKQQMTQVASRCILLRGIYVLLQGACNLDALVECRDKAKSKASHIEHSPTILFGEEEEKFFSGSFCYDVETIGKRYSFEEKKAIVDLFVNRTWKGNISRGMMDWKSPTHRFLVFIQHSLSNPQPESHKQSEPDGSVLRAFHVVQLCESNRSQLLGKYDLRKRPYIGTTSMPAEESISMANICCIQESQYVCDPFCGTGSLLVSAAHCGAQTIGMDADGRAMRSGSSKASTSRQMQQQRQLAFSAYTEEDLSLLTDDERTLPSMKTNFTLYRLRQPERMRMNFSIWKNCFRGVEIFDAILTDPPYGLREPRRRLEKVGQSISSDNAGDFASRSHSFVASTYTTHEVTLDLVLFAAEHLRLGGHLAFWFPTTDGYTSDELPKHPCMELEHDLPQRLSLKVVRRLVVMRKTVPLPKERPTRQECAPLKFADDLRSLMGVTFLPDNKEYMHYREKLVRKLEASKYFHSSKNFKSVSLEPQQTITGNNKLHSDAQPQQPTHNDDISQIDGGRKKRIITQEMIVANREKKIRLAKEKQEASDRLSSQTAPQTPETSKEK